jgi:hypothetical protein
MVPYTLSSVSRVCEGYLQRLSGPPEDAPNLDFDYFCQYIEQGYFLLLMFGPLMFFIGLGAGLIAAWLYHRSARAVLGERIEARDRQIREMEAHIQEASSQIDIFRNESSDLKAREAELNTALDYERKAARGAPEFVAEVPDIERCSRRCNRNSGYDILADRGTDEIHFGYSSHGFRTVGFNY